jgi:hypothetical protein
MQFYGLDLQQKTEQRIKPIKELSPLLIFDFACRRLLKFSGGYMKKETEQEE